MQEITDRRTTEQNRLMWSRLRDVAAQVEWPVDGRMQKLDAEDFKHIFTAALKKHQRVAAGIDGGFVILGQYTSRMTKAEMGDLITLIEAFGTNHGVVWSEHDVPQS